MSDIERKYIDLIFRASRKYAAWDPELPIEVGDWGTITTGKKGFLFWRRERGIFLKEGNIYADGTAKEHNIPEPKEHGAGAHEGLNWIVSGNAKEFDVNGDVGG
jgi:hypothetical protein